MGSYLSEFLAVYKPEESTVFPEELIRKAQGENPSPVVDTVVYQSPRGYVQGTIHADGGVTVARVEPQGKPVRKTFRFEIFYFKPSGKFYSEDKVDWEVAACGNNHEVAYMHEATDRIRQMRERREPLPGLSGCWDGPILVTCEDGFPCLILP